MIQQLTKQEQFKELLLSPTFLVWFSASWCGPCQRMDKKTLEETAEEMGIPFYYCDESVNRDTIDAVGIRSFPTFVLYDKGSEVSRRVSADTTKVCQYIRKCGQMESNTSDQRKSGLAQ